MAEFYLEIRWVHIASVYASGILFAVRGLASFAGQQWVLTGFPRYLSWTIDTVLLTAALMLTTIVRQYPITHSWLSVKVVLLGVYIVLGYLALRGGTSLRARVGLYLCALVVFAFVITVARAHHPLGIFAG